MLRFLLANFLFAFLFCVSCVRTVYDPGQANVDTLQQMQTAAAPPIPVWAVYLPSPTIPPLGTIRPVPAHQGWTNLRMERDLARMAMANISVALVQMTPQQLLEEEFRERFSKFSELAVAQEIKVVPFLVSHTLPAPALQRRNLAQFLVSQKLLNAEASLQQEGRPVVVVSAEFPLDQPTSTVSLPVRLLQLGKELPALPHGPLEPNVMQPNSDGFLWIRAADNTGCIAQNRNRPANDWIIRRQGGAPLKQQIQRAKKTGATVLLLDSWNNFERGSFVEPNSLEQDALLKILKNR